MEKESAKIGEADQSKFRSYNGDGNPTELSRAIFAILKQNPDTKWDLIGTGFFVTNNGIFITAKHVLLDVLDEDGNQLYPIAIFQFLPDNTYLIRKVIRCTVNDNADVGVGICAEMKNNKTGELLRNKVLTITNEQPTIGEPVFTYAYPNTANVKAPDQKLYFSPRYYEGEIVEYFENGRDRVFLPSPCFQTSITIHGGASGGPMFNSKGIVCGINSTGFSGCHDISFVSRIVDVYSLKVTDIKLNENSEPSEVTINELIKLRHIVVK